MDFLDKTLMKLDGMEWTVRNAVEGVQIFGGIGSGKTSGSGRTLALKYLQAGFGGLVLTVKKDEKDLWEKYCRAAGRRNDMIIVEPDGKHFFNFLEYESRDGNTENVVQVLKTVIQAGEEKANAVTNDPFWEKALDMLIFNIIDLCKLAFGKVTVRKMYDIVQALPSPERTAELHRQIDRGEVPDNPFEKAYVRAKKRVENDISRWRDNLPFERQSLLIDETAYDEAVSEEVPSARTFKMIHHFFYESFYVLHEKTRSIIEFSFSGFLFRLLRDPGYTLFCRYDSTFTPEDCWKGKIIILNIPVKLHHKVGEDCQILFKYIWQRAMEKREVTDGTPPVFLWADEAQHFLHEHDAVYQATARSSRIATVYISQNLPNYYASMGGAKSDFRVKSFLGTLNTKIFHANADVDTNHYASDLIGNGPYEDISSTTSMGGEHPSMSETRSIRIDKMVRPEFFAHLQTGSLANGSQVEAYIHLQGSQLADGTNHVKVFFNQS